MYPARPLLRLNPADDTALPGRRRSVQYDSFVAPVQCVVEKIFQPVPVLRPVSLFVRLFLVHATKVTANSGTTRA